MLVGSSTGEATLPIQVPSSGPSRVITFPVSAFGNTSCPVIATWSIEPRTVAVAPSITSGSATSYLVPDIDASTAGYIPASYIVTGLAQPVGFLRQTELHSHRSRSSDITYIAQRSIPTGLRTYASRYTAFATPTVIPRGGLNLVVTSLWARKHHFARLVQLIEYSITLSAPTSIGTSVNNLALQVMHYR